MKNQLFTRIAISLGLLATVACGSTDDGSGPAGGTVTAELQVFEFLTTTPFPPLAGVEVCVYGGEACEVTDTEGRVRLSLPANAETGVTFRKEGYVPGLTPYVTGESDFSALTVTTANVLIETLAAVLETSWPMDGTGVLSLGTIGTDPSAAGFDFGEDGIPGITISGADAGRRFYFDGIVPSTEIEATTNSLGTGGYVEMPPGDYEVSLGGTASNCRPFGVWEGEGSNGFAFPVVAGYITYAFVMCDPAP